MSWSDVATFPLAALVALAIGWTATASAVWIALRRLRRSAAAPWMEQARLVAPARGQIAVNTILIPVLVGEYVFFVIAPYAGLTPAPLAVLSALSGLLGVFFVSQRLERTLCHRPGEPARPEIAISWIFRLVALAPLALMLAWIPGRWGMHAISVLAGGTALVTFIVCGGWLALLRAAGLLRPASPRLAELVARVATSRGLPPPTTFELASPHANALAVISRGQLVYTVRLLDCLDDQELMTITAHELGHLAEPRTVRWTRLFAPYIAVLTVAGIPLGGSFGIWAGLAPVALLLICVILVSRLARRMEVRADRMGREQEGSNEGAYASALLKVYQANLIPVVRRGRRHAHPELYDRLVAAGAPPAFPRPAPPPRDRLAAIPLIVLILLSLWWAVANAEPPKPIPVTPPPVDCHPLM